MRCATMLKGECSTPVDHHMQADNTPGENKHNSVAGSDTSSQGESMPICLKSISMQALTRPVPHNCRLTWPRCRYGRQ
jgi:hypothetical protein